MKKSFFCKSSTISRSGIEKKMTFATFTLSDIFLKKVMTATCGRVRSRGFPIWLRVWKRKWNLGSRLRRRTCLRCRKESIHRMRMSIQT
jgi:hypothetical protein